MKKTLGRKLRKCGGYFGVGTPRCAQCLSFLRCEGFEEQGVALRSFFFFLSNFIINPYKIAVKIMKSSRSSQKLHLITDWRVHTECRQGSRSKNKTPSTCKNLPSRQSDLHAQMPQTCKNQTKASPKPDLIPFNSSKRINKSRSNSTTTLQQPNEPSHNLARRQELDQLCFSKINNQLRKCLIDEKCKCDIEKLNYHHLIKIMNYLKYVQHPTESDFMAAGDQEELKKVYCLWLSISVKRVFSLRNLMQVLQVLENISIDREKMDVLLEETRKQISLMQDQPALEENPSTDPGFAFFIKKIQICKDGNYLKLGTHEKSIIAQKFESFKLNKLKDCSVNLCTKASESQVEELPLISKKSMELASAKREKISAQIKTRRPQIQNIDLFDLLNYRERDFGSKTPKSPSQNIQMSRFCKKKKNLNEMKKDICQLAKPKASTHNMTPDELEYERNKQDYTFTPKIHGFRSESEEKLKKIKNIEKTVLRMKEGRDIRQQKENILRKGWATSHQQQRKTPKGRQKKKSISFASEKSEEGVQVGEPLEQKSQKYEVSKDYLRIPILYIDVNIQEGRKERIVIYDNDTAVGLAAEFGNKHGLPQQTVHRLEGLLQQQMDTVLARIDEENEDDCSILF